MRSRGKRKREAERRRHTRQFIPGCYHFARVMLPSAQHCCNNVVLRSDRAVLRGIRAAAAAAGAPCAYYKAWRRRQGGALAAAAADKGGVGCHRRRPLLCRALVVLSCDWSVAVSLWLQCAVESEPSAAPLTAVRLAKRTGRSQSGLESFLLSFSFLSFILLHLSFLLLLPLPCPTFLPPEPLFHTSLPQQLLPWRGRSAGRRSGAGSRAATMTAPSARRPTARTDSVSARGQRCAEKWKTAR